MNKYLKRAVLAALIIILAVILVRLFELDDYFTFEALKANKAYLKESIESDYLTSVIIYISIYIFVAAFSIPGAFILTMAGGFLFGVVLATFYINVGATTGAIGAFFISRFVIGSWFQEKFKDKLKNFNGEIEKNGAHYLLTLRFVPVLPFFVLNILSGLTKITLKSFLWTTSLGIIPGTLVYAYAGKQLNTIESPKDILSFGVILAFVLLGLFSFLPVIVKKIKERKNPKVEKSQ